MRDPGLYGRVSGVYTWQYNYFNNSEPDDGGGREVRVYMGAR